MSDSGIFVPPSQDASREKLWVETWKRLDRFLPDLRKELPLDEPKFEEKEAETAKGKEKEKTIFIEQGKKRCGSWCVSKKDGGSSGRQGEEEGVQYGFVQIVHV